MAQLFVRQGPKLGTTYPVEGDIVSIGREKTNDVCLPHETISRLRFKRDILVPETIPVLEVRPCGRSKCHSRCRRF